MSIEEEFRRVAMLSARAFYDDDILPTVDPGVAVVVIDALARLNWVREDKLAECLKLQFKQVQRTLRFFEAEKLVTREQRMITQGEYNNKKKKFNSSSSDLFDLPEEEEKLYSVALSATAEGGEEEEEKMIEYSYSCLHYAQMRDVVSYRLRWMNTKLAAADDNLLEKMKVQLKPLTDQLSLVKDLVAPDYGTLGEWKLRKTSNSSSTQLKQPRASAGGIDSSSSSRSSYGLILRQRMIKMKERMREEWEQRSKMERIVASLSLNERLASLGLVRSGLPPWKVLEERVQNPKMEGTSASMDLNTSKEKKVNKSNSRQSKDDELRPSFPSTSRIPRQPEGEGDSEREEVPNLESEIKKVAALLSESGMYLTAEHIKDACGVDVKGNNKDLFEGLLKYPRINHAQGLFYFESKHRARNRIGLVRALFRTPDGIPVADLKDEYPNAMEDIRALKANGDIWVLRNADVNLEMAYTRYDARSAPLTVVDDELKKLFRSADFPRDVSDIREKNRIRSAKRRKM